jgi:dienelactone hydrolase
MQARSDGVALPSTDDAVERRKQYLEQLLKILPHTTTNKLTGRINAWDKNWEDWVARTGELPPDFDSMPSIAELPDPLIFRGDQAGRSIATIGQWKQQRQNLRADFEHWVYGRMPPAPGNLRAVVTGTHKEGRVTVREVRLEFGPDHRAFLRVQLFIPEGDGPFPVLLTNQPRNHGWIYPAIRRGYIACTYNATDPLFGVADDSDKFIDVYPDYDFACIARWAWAGMRTVDYLYTLPEVDKKKIGITGHSRNGKQAVLAAAFDERIGAVVGSSGTTGECLPWRYTTDIFWGTGSIESITGGPHNTHWFHPRLRFFAGREHKLPVDQNMLMAMVAPRGLLLYAAYSEHEGNSFGYEQAYRSVRRVYQFLGREDNVGLHLRFGEHDFVPNHVENYVNFFDTIFGRRAYPKSETWISGYTFERWLQITGEEIDPLQYPKRSAGNFVSDSLASWEQQKQALQNNIRWALGEEPSGLPFSPVRQLPVSEETFWIHPPGDNPLALLFGRPLKQANMGSATLPFGDGLRADLYFPITADGQRKPGKLPIVLWLHPYSYATGYSRWVNPAFESLINRGFAVLAFDQLGFGTRVLDARYFYDQYPKWSLMGKIVADTRGAIDAVSALEMIDPSRIYLVGYALGAKAGLLTGALDSRVRGVAAVCGFEALRLSTPDNGTEGLAHYSHLHGLMPRLGAFIGQESRLPFDYDQALALIAPRPALLVAPALDRYAPVEDVRREVQSVAPIYRLFGRQDALRLETPMDFNRFPRTWTLQEQVIDWVARNSDSNGAQR